MFNNALLQDYMPTIMENINIDHPTSATSAHAYKIN